MELAKWAQDDFVAALQCARQSFNQICSNLEAWQIATYTLAATLFLFWLLRLLHSDSSDDLVTRVKKSAFRLIRKLPWVQRKISSEIAKTKRKLAEDIREDSEEFLTRLPEEGMKEATLLAEADRYAGMTPYDILGGQLSGAVYSGDPKLTSLLTRFYEKFAWSNQLHPDVFPGTRKMEAEVVRICINLFHGGTEACGTMTSGGTESILLACLAYRNLAYSRGNTEPEILMPVTAHAAFDKAAELFRIRLRKVPLDKQTLQVDIRKLRGMISKRTCVLVASAPNFPHGVIDPIEEIGKLATDWKIPFHVDACLGGFLLPFMKDAGFPLPPFDFRVPAVTSISCDTHKYGYTTKGSSVVLYRDRQYLHQQFFCQSDWPGGIYATPTLGGSRSGANVAVTWGAMMRFGRKGYVEMTRKIIKAARMIAEELEAVKGLEIMGDPQMSVVAFTSKVFDIYTMSDKLTKKGWHLNTLQFPPGIHICLTANHVTPGVAERFVDDVKQTAAELMKNPNVAKSDKATIYGTAQAIPDRTIINDMAFAFLDVCYSTEDMGAEEDGEKNKKKKKK